MTHGAALKLCVTYGILALVVLAPSWPMCIVMAVVLVLNGIDWYRGR